MPISPDYRPEGADKLAPEKQSAFDPKKKRMYHLDRAGAVVWEDKPEGFEYDAEGVLYKPLADEAVKPVEGK